MRFVGLLMCAIALLSSGAASYAADPLPLPTGAVVLTISGKIERTNVAGQAQFDMAMLEALGRQSIKTRSALSNQPQLFEGVPLRAVLDRVGAKGTVLTASALNAYEAKIPLSDLQYEPILATHVDGKVLKMRDKGPLWIVYPRDAHEALQDRQYDARWVWQLKRLHVE